MEKEIMPFALLLQLLFNYGKKHRPNKELDEDKSISYDADGKPKHWSDF